MEIRWHELSYLSFPDLAVISWLLDPFIRSLIITTDGAFLDNNGGQIFSRASLSFANWDSLSVRRYDEQAKRWRRCSYDYDELKDICEFEVSGEVVILKGFGRESGHWMEFKIIGGTTVAELH